MCSNRLDVAEKAGQAVEKGSGLADGRGAPPGSWHKIQILETEDDTKPGDRTHPNAGLSDECAALRKKVEELEEKLARTESIVRRLPFLYRGEGEEPICTNCWKVDQRVVEMSFLCGVCGTLEKDRSSRANPP